MRSGIHDNVMVDALQAVDFIYCLSDKSEIPDIFINNASAPYVQCSSVPDLLDAVVPQLRSGDAVLIMSNRGFGNIHANLAQRIHARFAQNKV